MAHLRQYLYSDRALSADNQSNVRDLVTLRSNLRHLGIDPDNVSICHPGPRFYMLGFVFIPTHDPRAALDRFLDDELGIPHVITPAPRTYLQQGLRPQEPYEGDTLVNTIRSQAWRTIHPQASQGRDPGDEYTG